MKHFILYTLACLFSFGVKAQNVTFQVDMNQYGGAFTTPEVNGTFNGWCGSCNAMSDANNDGIWDVTLPLSQGQIEYKFSHDGWAGQESLTPNTPCVLTTGGFTNRVLQITGDTILPPVCWESCAACVPPSNVTFQVDMNQYGGAFTTPEVNGTFNGWCGNCNAMTDANNDGIWEVTLPLTQSSIEYKFSHDAWAGQESLDTSLACVLTTGANTNRFIQINGDTVLPAVCWESCNECVDTSNVTFRVDMSEYTGSFTTPEINGTFNAWCGNCNPMTDEDNDSVWEITLPLTQDSIEYKFSYDAWAGEEDLEQGLPCTKTDGEYTNRFMFIDGDTILPIVCWESCNEECITTEAKVNVTFRVDMSEYSGSFTTPEVNGTFNGWCGNCNALEDSDGDNIWETTIELDQDTFDYKFSYDTWTGQETLDSNLSCTKTTTDEGGTFINRIILVTGDTVLPAVCWESCDTCGADSTTSILSVVNTEHFSLYPNPAKEAFIIDANNWGSESVRISLFNSLGVNVYNVLKTDRSPEEIQVSELKTGMYIVTIESSHGRYIYRMVVSE